MTDRTPESHPERLLAHEPWLGALARRLVRDEDEARDIVQETMRRAIDAPPREEHALRSFLGSIARHFAYDGTRRRKRRQQREQIAARAESLPSTVDLLARLDRQRDVQGEVLRLEEPFRETVLLRYYEELKPRQIAKRLGIPVATVKSRLRRGQERLRERMRERYGEKEWRAALAPLLTLPPTAFSTLAIPVAVALAFSATVVTAAWQWSAEFRASDVPEGMRRTEALALVAPELPTPSQVHLAGPVARRTTTTLPEVAPAIPRVAPPNSVRWPEGSLLWIDLERGLVRAPTQELCQISTELLASPEAVIDALAAGRSDVMFLPLASGEAPSRIADSGEALELHVLDAAGQPADDLPVCVIWRGDGEQRVLWRGRTQHGAVRAPLLRSALERLMPRGEVLATFDFPLADVRACVLSGVQVAGDVPCLQAPPSGAVHLALRDPWGAELPPGACAVLRARQPDGSTWEHALAWHAGSTRFGPIALGAEVEIEVRTPDLPVAVHRLPILHEAEDEPRFEIVAGAPSAQCSGRLLLVGGGELNHSRGLAELCDASGRILNRWRYELEDDGAFHFALAAHTDFDTAMVARLRLWVGSRLAEVPFAYPASGQSLSLGEIGLEDVVSLARGRVIDERGLGVADAVVRVDRQQKIGGRGPQLWVPHLHARTDADGSFELMGAYREQERFALEVEYPHAYGERRALHPTSDGELELLLRRGGTVEGAVILGAGIDLRSVAIVIYPSAGEHRVSALQPDASFRFHGVPPGLTRIEVVSTEGESGRVASFAPCCVMADAVVSAGILGIADRVHRIERRVLDARGPFADQQIELRGTALEGAWVWRGRSDRDGCIRLLVPIEVETLDLFHEGAARVRFAARDALGWIDLSSGPR